jgi:hypothetical protein
MCGSVFITNTIVNCRRVVITHVKPKLKTKRYPDELCFLKTLPIVYWGRKESTISCCLILLLLQYGYRYCVFIESHSLILVLIEASNIPRLLYLALSTISTTTAVGASPSPGTLTSPTAGDPSSTADKALSTSAVGAPSIGMPPYIRNPHSRRHHNIPLVHMSFPTSR